MTNRSKLENAFRVGLELGSDQDVTVLEYRRITEWDSIGHMALIAEIEDAFEVTLPTDDVIAISSFGKSIEILTKHGVSDLN
jgi:acyl carrier protein